MLKSLYFLLFILLLPYSQAALSLKQQEDLAFYQGQWRTNTVLILRDNEVVYEKYAPGFERDKPQRLWSITKSLSSLLIGIRLNELNLGPNEKVKRILNELKTPYPLTVRHLLQMSSGLKWNEFYESNPFQSDVVAMLYEKKDMGLFTARKPSLLPPGQRFAYSSGETNLLMKWFHDTFDLKEKHDLYPWEKLFHPLGIQTATWEQDQSGTFVGSSYAYMSARDLAKIGQLVLQGGQWGEEKILPQRYLSESLKNAPVVCSTPFPKESKGASYGFHWWLNRSCSQRKRPYPDLPEDLILALGHHGQTLAIFPTQKLIAIRFGADKKKRFPRGKWLKSVLEGINP